MRNETIKYKNAKQAYLNNMYRSYLNNMYNNYYDEDELTSHRRR